MGGVCILHVFVCVAPIVGGGCLCGRNGNAYLCTYALNVHHQNPSFRCVCRAMWSRRCVCMFVHRHYLHYCQAPEQCVIVCLPPPIACHVAFYSNQMPTHSMTNCCCSRVLSSSSSLHFPFATITIGIAYTFVYFIWSLLGFINWKSLIHIMYIYTCDVAWYGTNMFVLPFCGQHTPFLFIDRKIWAIQ